MESRIKNILLVDDSANDVTLIKSALHATHLANEISVAENGEEALDFLYKRGNYVNRKDDNPIFIILDIKMPLMDGIEVLTAIRSDASFNKVPVIMLTSSRNESDLQKCYDLGANSFVVKPIEINDFMRVVREIQQYWVIVNEPAIF
ncbi:MAG: response regulator [Bacteroidales bacterium]|nr:response regulator [Bacteroidales bacterium]